MAKERGCQVHPDNGHTGVGVHLLVIEKSAFGDLLVTDGKVTGGHSIDGGGGRLPVGSRGDVATLYYGGNRND